MASTILASARLRRGARAAVLFFVLAFVSVSARAGNTTYTYDELGRAVSTAVPTAGVTYTYDNVVLLRHASAADRIARVNGYVMTVGYGTSFIGGPNIPNPQMSFRMVGLPNRYHGKLRRIAVSGFHQGNDGEPQCMALAMDGTVFAWGPSNTFSLGLPENQTANAPLRVRL